MQPSWSTSWFRSPSHDHLPVVRRVTARALVLGLCLALVMAVLTPLNDWVWGNPALYGLYLPLGVTMLLLVMALVVNPLLGKKRFATGELVTVTVVLLVLGGVVSGGLARVLPGMLVGPAKVLPLSAHLAPLRDRGAGPTLPSWLFLQLPRQGPIPVDSADYAWEINGFFHGYGAVSPSVRHQSTVTWKDETGHVRSEVAIRGGTKQADQLDLDQSPGSNLIGTTAGQVKRWTENGRQHQATVLAVRPPSVPWRAWGLHLLAWGPLLIGSWLCCLAMAALVRRQWAENERLPFPIARFTYDLMQEPAKGRRVAELFRRQPFWIGVAIAFCILAGQGLEKVGWLPVSIPTALDYRGLLTGEPWSQVYDAKHLYVLNVCFTVVGLTFLLPKELGFSLWFFVILTNVLVAGLQRQGVPVQYHHVGEAGVGGWVMACLVVLWVGRRHYGALVRAAVMGSDDPAIQRVRFYVWLLLAGMAIMSAWLILAGAVWWHALMAVLLFLGFALVVARIVAEAGIPFVCLPAGCHFSQVLFGVVGVHAPLAALAPLALIGATVLGDGREHLLPYAVHGEYLANRALPRTTLRERLGWSGLIFATVAVGALLAVTVLIITAYRGEGWRDERWYGVLFSEGLEPMLASWQAHSNGGPDRPVELWWSAGVGGLVVTALTACRWAFAWWPLHPIGYLVSMTPPIQALWFSFFLGWLVKSQVMRYGGARIYVGLRPLAYGLVAGEAMAAGLFLLVAIACQIAGVRVPQLPAIFPG